MATNFPTSLDTLTNPSATDTLDSPPHDEQHADANDAIEALQAKVGVDSSAVTSSLDYRVGQLETGGGMTVSSTAPSSPAEGDMWYDDTSGRTYVYYDDGTSQQWVEFGAPPSGIGKVLQVVSTTKTDTFSASVNNGGNVAVTGLTATITPSSASSKILVLATLTASQETEFASSMAILTRGGTAIGGGDAASLRTPISGGTVARLTNSNDIAQATVLYLDSPSSTSALTYGINILCSSGSLRTIYVNRSVTDGDVEERPRSSSTITVMEVAA